MVNIFGDVFDKEGVLLEPSKCVEGRSHYELEWVLGKGTYEIGLILLVSFGKLGIDGHLWPEVVVDYKDGDPKNTNLINISYHFKNGPLPVNGLEGFYYLPFHTRYAIKKDGTLINIEKGNLKSWAVSKPCKKRNSQGGYRYTRVLNDLGQTKCLFRHRALCLTFKNYGLDPDGIVVNHKDGDPTNDDLDNLEWTTYSDNNSHAYEAGLRPNSCTPVLSKDLDTGKVRRFETLTSCARFYGYDRGEVIRRRILRGIDVLYTDRVLFKYDDGKPWPETVNDKTVTAYGGIAVMAKNVFSGKVYIFDNANQCAEFIGATQSNVHNHINREDVMPVCGYVCRQLRENVKWPKYTHRHLKVFKKYPKKLPMALY